MNLPTQVRAKASPKSSNRRDEAPRPAYPALAMRARGEDYIFVRFVEGVRHPLA